MPSSWRTASATARFRSGGGARPPGGTIRGPGPGDGFAGTIAGRSEGGGMAAVNTVRGPVEASHLGPTLMHEHVFVLSPEIEKTSAEWDEETVQDTAVRRLQELKDHGVDTIVDLTVIGLGRFMPRIVAVAERVPAINIVVATGVYTYDEVPMYFHFRGPGTMLGGPEPMTDLFVREIREGIADTGVRAA